MFDGDDISKMALGYADEISADLIIIMTEQEASPGFLGIGSAAQTLVNHSKVPVMSIRPTIDASRVATGY
jgi:nucleotide-binding universal stress UspA family protein